MTTITINKEIRIWVLGLSLFLIFFLPFLNLSLVNLLYCLLLIIIFNLFLYNLQLGFLSLLFLRPILDISVENIIMSFIYFDVNVLSLVGVLMLVMGLVTYFHLNKLKPSNLHHAWLLFLIIGLASLFQSFNVAETLRELLRLISIFASFFLAYKLFFAPRDLTLLIKVIIWSALIPTIIAIWQILEQSGLAEDGFNRIFGTFTHPNMYAFFLILPITLVVFLILNLKPSKIEVYLYSILFFLYCTALFFTYTRGAYLALLIIIGVIGAIKFKRFLIVALVSLAIVVTFLPTVQSRFYSIFQSNHHNSISWRLNLWNDGLRYFNNKSWSGYGLGTAEMLIASQRDFRLGSAEPHNDYLRVALDGGYPLLISYIILIALSIYSLINYYRAEDRVKLKNFFLFYSILLIAIFTMSFADNVLNGTALMWQLWALIGASIACTNFYIKQKKYDQNF